MSVKDEIGAMSFSLQGLVWDSRHSQAIVNGKIVEVGAELMGAQILEITKDGVRMRFKNQEFILRPKGRK